MRAQCDSASCVNKVFTGQPNCVWKPRETLVASRDINKLVPVTVRAQPPLVVSLNTMPLPYSLHMCDNTAAPVPAYNDHNMTRHTMGTMGSGQLRIRFQYKYKLHDLAMATEPAIQTKTRSRRVATCAQGTHHRLALRLPSPCPEQGQPHSPHTVGALTAIKLAPIPTHNKIRRTHTPCTPQRPY